MSTEISAIIVVGLVLVVMLVLVFKSRPALTTKLIDEAIAHADLEAEKAMGLGLKEQGGHVRLANAVRYVTKKRKSVPPHVARAAIIHRKSNP